MQRLEVNGAVRPIYGSLDVKGLMGFQKVFLFSCGKIILGNRTFTNLSVGVIYGIFIDW